MNTWPLSVMSVISVRTIGLSSGSRVEIEDLVATLDQILDDMAAGLAAAAGEHDPLGHFVLHFAQSAAILGRPGRDGQDDR